MRRWRRKKPVSRFQLARHRLGDDADVRRPLRRGYGPKDRCCERSRDCRGAATTCRHIAASATPPARLRFDVSASRHLGPGQRIACTENIEASHFEDLSLRTTRVRLLRVKFNVQRFSSTNSYSRRRSRIDPYRTQDNHVVSVDHLSFGAGRLQRQIGSELALGRITRNRIGAERKTGLVCQFDAVKRR